MLLVGTWVNMAFWTLEIVQVVRYFMRFKNDSDWVRGSVAGILFVDTVSTVAVCANTYLVSIYRRDITHATIAYMNVCSIVFRAGVTRSSSQHSIGP